MNLAQHLPRRAAEHPERPALVFTSDGAGTQPDQVVSFAELAEQSARVAGGLARLGLGPGARVLVLARPSPVLFTSLIALFRLGAVAVLLDPTAGLAQLEAAAALAAADAIIGGPAVLAARWLSPSLRRVSLSLAVRGRGEHALDWLARHGPERADIADVAPDHPALITFTGGSTGAGVEGPRGVCRTHGLLAAQHAAIAEALPGRPDDIDLVTFPILVLHNLASGVTSVVAREAAVVAVLQRWQCTTAAGAPAFWENVVDASIRCNQLLPLRRIVVGGAPINVRLVERLMAVAPGAEIVSVYGSSEVEPVATVTGPEILAMREAQGAALGRPVRQARVRILSEQGDDLPDGQSGELWVAGPHVSPSYFASPAADARHKRRDAAGTIWHRMGDVGYRAADGRLWQLGRTHTVIEQADSPVYPLPIEAAVAALPSVSRAALVAIPVIRGDRQVETRTVLAVELQPVPSVSSPTHPHIPTNRPALPRGGGPKRRFSGRAGGGDTDTRIRSAVAAVSPVTIDEVRVVRRIPMDARHRSRVNQARLRRQLIDAAWAGNLWAYLGERFPPLQHGLLIASYFAANALLAEASTPPGGSLVVSWRLVVGGVVLLLMFFHLRVVDEHKDSDSDLRVHPERVLSRGLVTLAQLRWLGLVAVGLELLLSVWLGWAALVGCLLILGLSLLIARDFFLGSRLERHMLVNALVHLLIMPAYSLFAFSVATGEPFWRAPPPMLLYAWVGYCVGLAFELARKTRAPEEERAGLVTYSRALGPYRAANLVLAAIAVAVGLSWAVGNALGLGSWYHLALLALLAVVIVGVLDFRRHTTPPRAARLKGYAGAFIFAFDVLTVVALIGAYGLRLA